MCCSFWATFFYIRNLLSRPINSIDTTMYTCQFGSVDNCNMSCDCKCWGLGSILTSELRLWSDWTRTELGLWLDWTWTELRLQSDWTQTDSDWAWIHQTPIGLWSESNESNWSLIGLVGECKVLPILKASSDWFIQSAGQTFDTPGMSNFILWCMPGLIALLITPL